MANLISNYTQLFQSLTMSAKIVPFSIDLYHCQLTTFYKKIPSKYPLSNEYNAVALQTVPSVYIISETFF